MVYILSYWNGEEDKILFYHEDENVLKSFMSQIKTCYIKYKNYIHRELSKDTKKEISKLREEIKLFNSNIDVRKHAIRNGINQKENGIIIKEFNEKIKLLNSKIIEISNDHIRIEKERYEDEFKEFSQEVLSIVEYHEQNCENLVISSIQKFVKAN